MIGEDPEISPFDSDSMQTESAEIVLCALAAARDDKKYLNSRSNNQSRK